MSIKEAELKAAVDSFHALGVPIIPVKIIWTGKNYDKKFLVSSWKKWETQQQTAEEITALNWEEANAFAVVLGTKTNNGVYLSVIDYDCKGDVAEDVKKKGLEILKDFPDTYREQTVNKGQHLIYWSKTQPKTISIHHRETGIELLGSKKLCIITPSYGYSKLNENNITEVDNIEQIYIEAMKKHGLLKEQNKPAQNKTAIFNTPRQCISEALQYSLTGTNGHKMRLAIAAEYKQHNYSTEEIIDLFRKHPDFDYNTCKVQVESADSKKTLTCKTIQQLNYCQTNCKYNKKIQQKNNKNECQEGKEQKSQAEKIVELFKETNAELFHDQTKTEYARIPITHNNTNGTNGTNDTFQTYTHLSSPLSLKDKDTPEEKEKETEDKKKDKSCENTVNTVSIVSAFEIVRLKDSAFKEYLTHLFYVNEQKIISPEAVNQAVSLLSYYAKQGKCYTLHNRVAPDPSGNGFWLDMADKQNRAYHITKDGWSLETDVPILFKRYSHQRALVVAVKSGDSRKLLSFVNVGANKNSETTKNKQLLLLVQTASYIIPDIAHPINAMFGCPGTHKTSAQRFIREVIDPSAVPCLSIPKNEQEALQILDNHYIPIFDNIADLPKWFSETLCKAVTGMGQECRALYTNDGSFIRSFRRCIMLNGLNLPAYKGDLLNRTIIHPTEPTINRRTEQELNTEFAKFLPEILGGFLDAIVKALNLKETLKPPKLYRLADFSEWGYLLAEALGYDAEDFVKAMDENLREQEVADIENNVVADAFLAYLAEELTNLSYTEENPMKMSPEAVFKAVTDKAEEKGIAIKSKKWPSATNTFTRKLNESKTGVIAHGWNYEIMHDGKKREIHIWRIGYVEPSTVDDGQRVDNYKKLQPTKTSTFSTEHNKSEKCIIIEHVLPAEPCPSCTNFAVEFVITLPTKEKLRFCPSCCNKFEKRFSDVSIIYKQ